MPTQRMIKLPRGVKTTSECREMWTAWVEVCRELWAECAPSPGCGFALEMPEAFPADAYYTWEGTGVAIDDGERDYDEGMEAELETMAKVIRSWTSTVGRAAAEFSRRHSRRPARPRPSYGLPDMPTQRLKAPF
jgi:hypothetical protein